MSFTGVIILILAIFIILRCNGSITYDRGVNNINVFTETCLLVIFLGSLLSDIIEIQLTPTFLVGFAFINLMSIIGVHHIMSKVRINFLRKVDIFNYKKESDALLMMVYLHQLIEGS